MDSHVLVVLKALKEVADTPTLLTLGLVCKSIHVDVYPTICEKVYFRHCPEMEYEDYTHYKVQSVASIAHDLPVLLSHWTSVKKLRILSSTFCKRELPSPVSIPRLDVHPRDTPQQAERASKRQKRELDHLENSSPGLPPNLTHLDLVSLSLSLEFPLLPAHKKLTHLYLCGRTSGSLENLPPTLTHFSYVCTDISRGEVRKDFVIPNLNVTDKNDTKSSRFTKLSRSNNLEANVNFPHKLTHLTIPQKVQYDTTLFLASSLEYLDVGDHFDQTILEWPPALSRLIFGCNFNVPLENLPISLKYLSFGRGFGQRLSNLPLLTHLVFAQDYKRKVDGLPRTLTHLTLGQQFVCESTAGIPPTMAYLGVLVKDLPSLTYLHLQTEVQLPEVHLPPTVTHFRYSSFNRGKIILPPKLSHFWYPGIPGAPGNFERYLASDRQLQLPLGYKPPGAADPEQQHTFSDLPALTHLRFEDDFNTTVDSLLPPTLTYLRFGRFFNRAVDSLPASLTRLHFGDKFNSPVEHLPVSLTYLVFGADFNHTVDNLPQSLIHLKFGSQFNQTIDNLPPLLTYLILGVCFNQPVEKIPSSLRYIAFGLNYRQPKTTFKHVSGSGAYYRSVYGSDRWIEALNMFSKEFPVKPE